MLHEYLGPDIFRDGLRHYLSRHKYGNTDTVDLWQALEEISGKPVKNFMHAWTSQPGFPLLETNVVEDRLELVQQRFFLNPEHSELPPETWPIALLATNDKVPELMTESSESVMSHELHDIKFNRRQSGFYRVTYNPTHLQRMGELIKRGHLEPQDRLGILSDVFEAAKAGKSDTADALHFLGAFEQEDNNAVWDVIAMSIGAVRNVMDDEELREDMKPFIRKLTARQLQRLGWEGNDSEPYFDKLLRPTILSLASAADEPTVVKEALARFETMNKPEDVHPDIRGAVYGTAVRHGDVKTFEKLFTFHENSNLSEERTALAGALTGFKQPELVDRALGLIKTESVRLQDASYWIAYSFMNRFAREKTWAWMQENWDWLAENLGTDLSFYRFPMYAANAFSRREFLEDYKAFFLPRREPAFERSINQGIEVLQWQSAWRERDLKEVEAFFRHQADQ
jgi:aminopeptidase N